MVVEPEELRLAMRRWATGVTVVTTQMDGVRHGMTVNSFTSISLTPPLVMVSLEQSTRTQKYIKQTGFFGVTILSSEQQEISDRFAGRISEHQDRFTGLETRTLITGAPFVLGGLAFIDCRVVATFDAGTHTLFIAQVEAVHLNPFKEQEDGPLLYYNRSYRELQ